MFALWLFLSLLSPFIWACGNIIDRYLSTKTIRNEYAMTFVACMSRLPLFIIFWAAADWYIPSWENFVLWWRAFGFSRCDFFDGFWHNWPR